LIRGVELKGYNSKIVENN